MPYPFPKKTYSRGPLSLQGLDKTLVLFTAFRYFLVIR